jgi:hypothetical protein
MKGRCNTKDPASLIAILGNYDATTPLSTCMASTLPVSLMLTKSHVLHLQTSCKTPNVHEMTEPLQQNLRFEVSHGFINVRDSTPPKDNPNSPLVLLLHGNSFCLKIWKHIFASDLAQTYVP